MRRDRRFATILFVVVSLTLLVACGAGSAASAPTGRASSGYAAKPAIGALPADATGLTVKGQAVPPGTVTSPLPPVAEGPRVIRTAQIGVEVHNGSFDSTLDELYLISSEFGGYISGSTATAETGSLRTGTITFQVPADKFDLAVKRVRGLGKVQNFSIGGQDVSAQYVDLQARLRNAEAQRDAMLALLARATTIQEILAVQNQVGQVTAQVEQLRGQINYLDHATTYSTVSVSLHEAAVVAHPEADRSGLGAAFSDAARGFVNTLSYILVGIGDAGPVLILAGLGLLAWRLRRRFAL